MTLAEADVAALLETDFDDVHPLSERLVYEADVRERRSVTVSLPSPPTSPKVTRAPCTLPRSGRPRTY